jgi:hypothetical protein
MRSALLTLAIVLLAPATALGDDEPEVDIPGLDAADLRGDALVWEDANLYLEPWENGASVRFQPFGRGRREEVGRAIPVRIVDSTMRSFVEIELANRADCTWRRLEADPRIAGLRLFVRRDDLAPVLVKPFSVQHSDGTKIKLAIGTPVAPTSGGDYLISVKQDKLRLPIPHASVSYLYKAGKITEPDLPRGKLVRIERNGLINARLGEQSYPIRSNWFIAAPATKTTATLAHLTTRCIDMVVSVPSSALRPSEPPRATAPTGTISVRPSPWIPAGAPLSTPSGREAAVAGKDISVTVPAPPSTIACFDARLNLVREDDYPQVRTIKLCAPSTVLEH